jgi:hypothetical protein
MALPTRAAPIDVGGCPKSRTVASGWLWWTVKIHHSSFNLLHSPSEDGWPQAERGGSIHGNEQSAILPRFCIRSPLRAFAPSLFIFTHHASRFTYGVKRK